jgi:hypothetical protein
MSLLYTITCYKDCDLYKWKHDITRDGIPIHMCKGNNGFDKNLSLQEVVEYICIPKGGSLIIKNGPNAKWYVKTIDVRDVKQTICDKQTNYTQKKNSRCYLVINETTSQE